MSVLWNVIRGGQLRIHNIRMFFQVAKRITIIGLVVYGIFVGVFFFFKTTESQRHFGWQWLFSRAAVQLKFSPNNTTNFTYYKNKRPVKIVTTHRNVLSNLTMVRNMNHLRSTFINGVYWGGLCVGGFIVFVGWYLYRSGSNVSRDKLVGGVQIVKGAVFDRQLRSRHKAEGSSEIKLAGFSLPAFADTTHTFILGAAGSGKSVLCREMLSGIREKERRAIVYDVSGEFLRNFYQPDKDIILNPLDARTVCWDIWLDCQQSAHFHSLAEALIPEENNRKDFFVTAARAVVADMAERFSHSEKPSLEKLLELLLTSDFKLLLQQVKGTKAAAILNQEGGRTAASVRAVIAANIQSLTYLPATGRPFSIREWVQREDHPGGFIFITSNAEQLALLRPLITLWVNTATSAIMGLPPDRNRRIYLLLDELASLNRVPALHSFLAQGRKYGGCAILCTQSYSQMLSLWGSQETKAIAGGCSNWAVLRCNDIDSANWLSSNLCRQDNIEKTQGVSYGAHEMRDSVSVQEQRRERPLVSPTELLNLEDLTGYLRFGQGLPLVKFVSQFIDYPAVAAPFVARPNVAVVISKVRDEEGSSENDYSLNLKEIDSPFL